MALEPTANDDETPAMPDKDEDSKQRKSVVLRGGSFITFLIKLGGLVIAGNEALFKEPPRDAVVFALAAFMMAGAQGLDNIIDNFFGNGKSQK